MTTSKRFSKPLLIVSVFLLGLLSRSIWDKTFKPAQPTSSIPLESVTPPTSQLPSEVNISSPPEIVQNHCKSIYRMVCQRDPIRNDPTGIVRSDLEGEKLALRLYADIIQNHRDWNIDQIDEEMAAQTFTPARRNRMISAFKWVKKSVETFIDQQDSSVFTLKEKQAIQARLRKTQLDLPPPAKIYEDEPDLLTKNEIYYERTPDGKMKLLVGGAYVFVAKSWFNIVFTMAHELAHSIDPCEMKAAHLLFPAYKSLTKCFIQNGYSTKVKSQPECSGNDQISETFADWVAVQVTSSALKLYSTEFHGPQIIDAARNSVRDLCEQDTSDGEFENETHPSSYVRISKIFGNNPSIRTLLGCESESVTIPYCSFEPRTTAINFLPKKEGP